MTRKTPTATGNATEYTYDHRNRLVRAQEKSPGGIILREVTYINHLAYDRFGQLLSQANPPAGDRYTYTGREYDATLGQYYYRARFYDLRLGRFTSADLLAFAARDANLYPRAQRSPG